MVSKKSGEPTFPASCSQSPLLTWIAGVVYEKRLIEQYINEHGTEPDSGNALTTEDLLPLQTSRIVRPRPATLTSIPALLATFQNEWDALALETYNVQEQLARTREELATALYQHDAAVRVIARLTKERDEARTALSKITVADGAVNGDQMVVDSVEALPESLAARVDETHKAYVDSGCLIPRLFSLLTFVTAYPRTAKSDQCRRAGCLEERCLLSKRRHQMPSQYHKRRHWAWMVVTPLWVV